MSLMFFPDNTVLVNFGIINRYDLLAELVRDGGRWCATVAEECDMSAAHHPAMSQAHTIFGEPIRPEGRENADSQILRQAMVRPSDGLDHRYKHLGEAETITIVVTRGWAPDAIFLTDDGDAATYAQADGIKCLTTWDLFRLAHRARPTMFDEAEAWRCVQELDIHKRVRRPCPPVAQGKAAFIKWLTET